MADSTTETGCRTALVLGAGGTVGIAYHAGVLKALADAGIDAADADLVVGTSAGAIAGSIVRSGHDVEDMWALATENTNKFDADAPAFRPDVIFRQGWRTPVGLARRTVGAGYVINRSVLHWPPLEPPLALRRVYRGGLASVTEQRRELAMWTGEEWPEAALSLCTFDIVTGRRVVLGRESRLRPALPDAVRAAAAVPGLYPPVRMGRRMLVDGGVRSSTNLDVAVAAGARLIIVAAPLASDPDDRPAPVLRAARLHSDRRLRRELRAAEAAGAHVLVLRPGAEEAKSQGLTFLRTDEHGESAELTRARTAAVLRTPAGRGFRRRWVAATAHAGRRDRSATDRRDVGT